MKLTKTEIAVATWAHAMEYRDAMDAFRKPDRRAELLELASMLAVADRPKLDGDDLLVTGDCDGFEPMVERAMKQKAHVIVTQAAAIIAEVDRVSGEVVK